MPSLFSLASFYSVFSLMIRRSVFSLMPYRARFNFYLNSLLSVLLPVLMLSCPNLLDLSGLGDAGLDDLAPKFNYEPFCLFAVIGDTGIVIISLS